MNSEQVVQQIKESASQQQDEVLALLEQLVCVQSGSYNVEGVNKVQGVVAAYLSELGCEVEMIPGKQYGDQLLATIGNPHGFRVLLVGHVDTIFEADTDPSYRLRKDRCYGQGVADMKGGVVVLLQVVQIAQELGWLDELQLGIYLNSHEEISRDEAEVVMAKLAKQYDLALVFEPCGKHGEIVSSRMGSADITLSVIGKAGHAGSMGSERANAIEELAFKITQLSQWAAARADLLLSTGKISGGGAVNVIPDHAEAVCDVRFANQGVLDEFEQHLQQLIEQSFIKGTVSQYEIAGVYPPMNQSAESEKMIAIVQQAGELLARRVGTEHRGGVSDGCVLSACGLPVLDGLGARGGGVHSTREYIFTQSLFEQVELVSVTMYMISQQVDELRRNKRKSKKGRYKRLED